MNAILVASNRGPVSFTLSEDGALSMRSGRRRPGLRPVGGRQDPDVLWVCAALSDGDRGAVRPAPGGRLDQAGTTPADACGCSTSTPATFHRAYNAIANSTLWFVHHLLYDTPIDAALRRQRSAGSGSRTEAYNEAFAMALAEEAAHGARVMVQDYHLSLAPACSRRARPDLRIGHFSHTPWAPPDYFALLPDDVAAERARGHPRRRPRRLPDRALGRGLRGLLRDGARRRGATATAGPSRTRAAPPGSACTPWAWTAGAAGRGPPSPTSSRAWRALRDQVGDRQADRADRPDRAVQEHRPRPARLPRAARDPPGVARPGRAPRLRLPVPARPARYREYTAAVQRLRQEIEDEFGTEDWQPLILNVHDDYPRSLAAYRLADVLLVNPIRDGMNLVAKEGPSCRRRGCALVLSREAGAAAELGEDALLVNPYDVSATAAALRRGPVHVPRANARQAGSWPPRPPRCPRTSGSRTSSPPSSNPPARGPRALSPALR